MEEIWNFGYRCNISLCEFYWVGTVYAPIWHPIRSTDNVGLSHLTVLLIKGEWNLLDDFPTSQEAFNEVFKTAFILKMMQEKWDSLSPYEREYLVWT